MWAVLLIALACALGGCAPDITIQDILAPAAGHTRAVVSVKTQGGSSQLVLVGSYKPKFLSQGVITRHATTFTGKGASAVGTFGFRLANPDAAVKKALGEFANGNWRSTFDFHGDISAGTAIATGVVIVTFKVQRAGALCISATVHYRNAGKTITNSFHTLGGTGDGARVHASGTYSRTRRSNGSVAVRAHVQGGLGKGVPFTQACRQLSKVHS